MKKAKKCLKCKNPGKLTRGLCHKDYCATIKKIARGEVSEKVLIKKKLLLPGKTITSGRNNKMFMLGSNKRGHASHSHECLVRKCTNKVRNKRGLCITHHSYAWDLIRKKKATEEDLVRRKLMYAKGRFPGKVAKKSALKKRKKKSTITKTKRLQPKIRRRRKASLVRKPKKRKNVSKTRSRRCRRPYCKKKQYSEGLCKNHFYPEPPEEVIIEGEALW